MKLSTTKRSQKRTKYWGPGPNAERRTPRITSLKTYEIEKDVQKQIFTMERCNANLRFFGLTLDTVVRCLLQNRCYQEFCKIHKETSKSNSFFNKVTGFEPATRLQHRWENFAKILRTPVFIKDLWAITSITFKWRIECNAIKIFKTCNFTRWQKSRIQVRNSKPLGPAGTPLRTPGTMGEISSLRVQFHFGCFNKSEIFKLVENLNLRKHVWQFITWSDTFTKCWRYMWHILVHMQLFKYNPILRRDKIAIVLEKTKSSKHKVHIKNGNFKTKRDFSYLYFILINNIEAPNLNKSLATAVAWVC